MFCIVACIVCGCAGGSDPVQEDASSNEDDTAAVQETSDGRYTEKDAYTLAEIRTEAEEFQAPYANMDFSEAVFDIPDVDTMELLSCPLQLRSAVEIEEALIEDVAAFIGNSDLDRENFHYVFQNQEDEGIIIYEDDEEVVYTEELIPIDEVEGDDKYDAPYISYYDGTYMSLLYRSTYMMELADETLIADLMELETYNNIYPLRGMYVGTQIADYDLTAPELEPGDISYTMLDGVELTLADAVSYVEGELPNYNFLYSPYLEYKVCDIQVMRIDEETYSYFLHVGAAYKGVDIQRESGLVEVPDGNADEVGTPLTGDHFLYMFYSDRISYMWTCAHNYPTVETEEVYDQLLSIEQAADIVSSYISDSAVFKISSVRLLYEAEYYEREEATDARGIIPEVMKIHPVYQFKVSNPELSGCSKIVFQVDAVTGKLLVISL